MNKSFQTISFYKYCHTRTLTYECLTRKASARRANTRNALFRAAELFCWLLSSRSARRWEGDPGYTG